MKKYLKVIFIILLLSGVGFTITDYAIEDPPAGLSAYDRGEETLFSSRCPKPPTKDFISICGVVRRPVPRFRDVSDWLANSVDVQEPLQGVSVYVYEADNSAFSSGKRDGKLVHPFASTTTNAKGQFHILARKMDNNIFLYSDDPNVADTPLQANIRYLVFSCGGEFAGMQVIPSFENMVDVVQESPCLKNNYTYVAPPEKFNLISEKKVAVDIGKSDEEYPEGYNLASHAYNSDDINYPTRQSIDINLEGADPRFTRPDNTEGKQAALNSIFWLFRGYPQLGSFWSKDCYKKYDGTHWAKLCAGAQSYYIGGYHQSVVVKDDGTVEDPSQIRNLVDQELLVEDYYKKLKHDPNYLVQALLPNIAPQNDVLYFRPFEISVDVTNYVKDPADISRSLGLHYSNCAGMFIPRFEGSESKEDYIDCEVYRECNNTVNSGGLVTSRSSQLAGGPSQALQSPLDIKTLLYEIDPEIPVCIKDGEIIKIGDIQPPNDKTSEDYKLDYRYWSNEFLLHHKGEYNHANVETQVVEVEKDSKYPPIQTTTDILENVSHIKRVDRSTFEAKEEGRGPTVSSGGAVTFQSSKRPAPLRAAYAISHGDESVEPLTDFLSHPSKKKDILSYKTEILSGSWNYSTAKPYSHVIYSSINKGFANKEITNPSGDQNVYQNNKFGDKMEGNLNHYPIDDLLSAVNPTPEDKTRTRTTAIYETTTARERTEELKNFTGVDENLKKYPWGLEVYDSFISITSGTGKINWKQISSFGWYLVFGHVLQNKEEKTFIDRDPDVVGGDFKDDLKATFEINEANFTQYFPLPGVSTGLDPGDWGENACYPWEKVPFTQICDTYQGESSASDGSINPGWNIGGDGWGRGISRTCKTQLCYKVYTSIDCNCSRDYLYDIPDPENPGQFIHYYTYSSPVCPDTSEDSIIVKGDGIDVGIKPGNLTECDPTPGDTGRLTCAQRQKTCYLGGDDNNVIKIEKRCMREDWYGEIKNKIEEAESLGSTYCEGLDYPIGSETSPDPVYADVSQTMYTPLCEMYVANGNVCDGDIRRNETIILHQQVIDANSTNSEQDRINVDSVTMAGPELRKSFESPLTPDFTTFPWEAQSVNTSVRDGYDMNEGRGSPTELKDAERPSKGDKEGTRTRGMFTISPYFGKEGRELKDMFIHCKNSTLGTSGEWDCELNTLPNPEVVTIFGDPVVVME